LSAESDTESTAGGGPIRHAYATESSGIASGVWVADTLDLSGQLPTPITPADRKRNSRRLRKYTGPVGEHVPQDPEPVEGAGLGMGDIVIVSLMPSTPAPAP
jgi:hypothetical protein